MRYFAYKGMKEIVLDEDVDAIKIHLDGQEFEIKALQKSNKIAISLVSQGSLNILLASNNVVYIEGTEEYI